MSTSVCVCVCVCARWLRSSHNGKKEAKQRHNGANYQKKEARSTHI